MRVIRFSWIALVLGWSSLTSCYEDPNSNETYQWHGEVQSQETNGNGVMEGGESTTPKPSCGPVKNYCSQGIHVEWEMCLTEIINQEEGISIDANGKEVCAWFSITFDCVGGKLVKGEATCVENYCSFVLPPPAGDTTLCGWKTRKFVVYNDDGTLNDRLSASDLQDFGYELLPVGP